MIKAANAASEAKYRMSGCLLVWKSVTAPGGEMRILLAMALDGKRFGQLVCPQSTRLTTDN